MLNQLYLARLMIHPQGFVSDAAFQDSSGGAVIDTSAVFYDGNSQGGIFGGTVVAISQDITRGVLGVPGMNYSLLLTRSTDFAIYAGCCIPRIPTSFTGRSGWRSSRCCGIARTERLRPPHDDRSTSQHAATQGAPAPGVRRPSSGEHRHRGRGTDDRRLDPSACHRPRPQSDVVPYYGIPAIPTDPFDGSALIVWDSGAATPPITNTAPSTGEDPHSDPRNSPVARQQKSDFLRSDAAWSMCAPARRASRRKSAGENATRPVRRLRY
jgi:hypothetical protein